MTSPQLTGVGDDIDLARLAMDPNDVAHLLAGERERRVLELIGESYGLLDWAAESLILGQQRSIAGVCVLFSGGNDSTVMAHLFRERITHAVHANTTIGIEETREFVRKTCTAWNVPLIEHSPGPGDTYRDLVLDRGFPGPGMHYKMYQRLKERALRKARKELVNNGRRERVIFLAGRRRTESQRRAEVPEFEVEGSIVWVSPMVNWTKLDLNTYRRMVKDVPINRVTDILHMSGECLCGAFAHEDELSEIAMWFPGVAAEIAALEAEIADRDDIPEYRKHWGWGGDPDVLKQSRSAAKPKSGRLCSSCDARWLGEQQTLVLDVP